MILKTGPNWWLVPIKKRVRKTGTGAVKLVIEIEEEGKKKKLYPIVKTYLICTEMRFGGNLRSVSENKIKEILVLDHGWNAWESFALSFDWN